MKTLERYVFGAFLSSFLLAFLVLTFVLTIGLMVQIVGLLMGGVPMELVGSFILMSFPETLQWTVPLALLTASVLVFSRLSADSEIAAMRACGVNLLTVMKWPLVFAFLCSLLGFYLNHEVVTRGHELRRSLKAQVTVGAGLDVLEPGKVIDVFPKVKLYFSGKEGNWLHDLVIVDYTNPDFERQITASKALVTSEGSDLTLDLYQLTVDPLDAEHPTMAHANRFQYTIKNAFKSSRYTKRDKDLRFFELWHRLGDTAQLLERLRADGKRAAEIELVAREQSRMRTEFSRRLVFACAAFCFVLVGIPLGIKSQRKESTIGMAISLSISLGYYLLVILMLSLEEHSAVRPDLLLALPVIGCLVIASRLVSRNM